MACTHAAFDAMPWTAGGHPLERKKAHLERPLTLLELAPGFVDPNLCRRSHAMYVVRGTLELELDDRREVLGPGESCWLDAGTAHRARNAGDGPLVLFVASDLEVAR